MNLQPLTYQTAIENARKQCASLSRDERLAWIRTWLAIHPLNEFMNSNSQLALDAVADVSDLISNTGRGRLYLLDAYARRLFCRKIWGQSAACTAEPVSVGVQDWKVAEVFRNGQFVEVESPQGDDQCNHVVADRINLSSCWLFPIGADAGRFGVLCIDDPRQVNPAPGIEERDLIANFLAEITESLRIAKAEYDRSELLFKSEKLVALHSSLTLDNPSARIFDELFDVAKALQPNLSMIFVRMKQGAKKGRLHVEGFWPQPELEHFFSDPRVASIDMLSLERRFVFDLNKTDKEWPPPLTAFMGFFHEFKREYKIPIDVGSILSLPICADDRLLGVCNFITSTPRAFLADEEATLRLIVAHAAVALGNAQRILQRNRLVQCFKLVSKCVNLVIDSSGTLEDAANIITLGIAEAFDTASVSCLLADHDIQTLKVISTAVGSSVAAPTAESFSFSEGISGLTMSTGQCQVLTHTDEKWGQYYKEIVPGILTCAAIPLPTSNGPPLGVLAIESNNADAFSQDDIDALTAIAGQLSSLIVNVELVENLRAKNEELLDMQWAGALGETAASAVQAIANYFQTMPSLVFSIKRALEEMGIGGEEYVFVQLDLISEYVNQLRELAHRITQSGARAEKTEIVAVLEVIEEQIKAVTRNQQADEGTEFIIDGERELLVTTDRQKLADILFCLFDNADKAALNAANNRPPNVRIDLQREGNTLHIDVADSGLGMQDAVAKRVCQYILNGDWEGRGISLFISAQKARRLGGSLSLLKNETTGATFRLSILLRLDSEHQG